MPSSIPRISQLGSHCASRLDFRSFIRGYSKLRRPLHLFGLMVVLLASWKPLIGQLVQVNHISTIAGIAGSCGNSGDGGMATGATLNEPVGTAVNLAGDIFIVDQGNNNVRKITASTGIITTVAGDGNSGFSGDGGAATNAELNRPKGIALDAT